MASNVGPGLKICIISLLQSLLSVCMLILITFSLPAQQCYKLFRREGKGYMYPKGKTYSHYENGFIIVHGCLYHVASSQMNWLSALIVQVLVNSEHDPLVEKAIHQSLLNMNLIEKCSI